MYVIINKKNKKMVYGTDYRYNPPHQRLSWKKCLTFEDREEAEYEFRHRRCGKDYVICEVNSLILQEPDNNWDELVYDYDHASGKVIVHDSYINDKCVGAANCPHAQKEG